MNNNIPHKNTKINVLKNSSIKSYKRELAFHLMKVFIVLLIGLILVPFIISSLGANASKLNTFRSFIYSNNFFMLAFHLLIIMLIYYYFKNIIKAIIKARYKAINKRVIFSDNFEKKLDIFKWVLIVMFIFIDVLNLASNLS